MEKSCESKKFLIDGNAILDVAYTIIRAKLRIQIGFPRDEGNLQVWTANMSTVSNIQFLLFLGKY